MSIECHRDGLSATVRPYTGTEQDSPFHPGADVRDVSAIDEAIVHFTRTRGPGVIVTTVTTPNPRAAVVANAYTLPTSVRSASENRRKKGTDRPA